MSYEWLASISLAKIIGAFLIFFVYLPRKMFPQRRGAPWIERFFDNFVWMTGLSIVAVHILALTQLYSIASLLLCYLALYAIMFWYRKRVSPLKRLEEFLTQKIVLALDIFDQVAGLKSKIRERLRSQGNKWREWSRNRSDVLHAVLFGVILLYSGILRYYDAFRSAAFGFSDPYVHLILMKKLESGVLYPPGDPLQFYPKGFHAFLAILHGLTGVDSAMCLRLVGPFVGVLLVASVYYGGKKLTGNKEAALVGMFLYGTSTLLGALRGIRIFPQGTLEVDSYPPVFQFIRQSAPLAEEFGLLFLVCGIFAAYSYLFKEDRRNLFSFLLASLAISMAHPLVAAAYGAGMIALLVLSLALQVLSWKTLLIVGGGGLLAGFLGSLQILYGWFFAESLQETAVIVQRWFAEYGESPYTAEIIASAALGVLFFSGGLIAGRGKEGKLLWSFVGLFLLLLGFGSYLQNFGFQVFIPPDRVDNYRLIVFCLGLAGAYYAISMVPLLSNWYRRKRWVYQMVTAAVLGVMAAWGIPAGIPSPPRYEYNLLAQISYDIKRSFPPLEWIVVSTVEDYSKIFRDKGWHMNADEFLDRYNPYDRDLMIPIPYTFIFVEKKPFPYTTDPKLKKPGARLDIERRLQEWTSVYKIFHEDMEIFREDRDVLVYLISRPGRPGLEWPQDWNQAHAAPPSGKTVSPGLRDRHS